jgi:hypothetical protein
MGVGVDESNLKPNQTNATYVSPIDVLDNNFVNSDSPRYERIGSMVGTFFGGEGNTENMGE